MVTRTRDAVLELEEAPIVAPLPPRDAETTEVTNDQALLSAPLPDRTPETTPAPTNLGLTAPPVQQTHTDTRAGTTPVGNTQVPQIGGVPSTGGLAAPRYSTSSGPLGSTDPVTREVTEQELVSNQLESLLSSDSPYIRRTRLQGLEMGGGLGGTLGIQAAIGQAIASGLPIAAADAQAYRDAAAQNMNALNQFGLANLQRATQLEVAHLDANTRLQTTHMNNTANMAIARLQSATQRDIANADNATRVRVAELNGIIQERLADIQFQNNKVLSDMENAHRLGQISLQGEYGLEQDAVRVAAQREANYVNAYVGAYDGALARIASFDGIEMDDAARERAIASVWEGFEGMTILLNNLYPDVPPMQFGGGG